MELRHLRYFVVLADELHFGRAAKRLNISQPPLTVNIKQLEASLGVMLFERSSRGVKLTPAGEAFRKSALQVLAQVSVASSQAREVAAGVTSRVRIGFVGSMLFRGLPERLARFQRLSPQVQVELTEINSAQQLDALLKGAIDLGFVHTDRIAGELHHALYMSEPFVLCLPEGHKANAVEGISPDLLKGMPFVLFSRGASPDYYERVITLCASLGWNPLVRHEVRHWLSVVALVRQGMGAALVPRALIDSGVTGVVFKALPDAPIRSDVYMVWRDKELPEGLLECLLVQV
ncbi:LysR family transcriptional regulator [Orrella daihaiensis]|uniref:LysR family transcriptional regulator n=1 Tax=Orrella daihaiensis TaxID=2782176 RepID=UPI0021128A17|nr:LysR family transcriptional regulator [Orrella daihaiensis]